MECSNLASVRSLQRGQHACLVYGKGEDPLAAVAPFVADGLAAGERCIVVVGELEPRRIEQAFAQAGVDVARARQRGALGMVTRWEVSFPDGEFDPAAMVGFVREAIAQALAEGFTGVRVVAEMTWALRMGVGANKLIHYEALGNSLYPDEPLVAICMYDRTRFPAEVCYDALRVHPWVVLGECAHDNLYYEPPAAVVQGASAGARVDWMLEQLRRVRAAEAQRHELVHARAAHAQAEATARHRDELLGLLAHELRTPLTSLLASAQMALRMLDAPAALAEDGAVSLRRTLERVVRQAGKQSRLIDQVLDAARATAGQLPLHPEPCDVAALAREVAELAQSVSPRHTLTVQAPAAVHAVVDPLRLEQVLTNLLDNARKHSPAGSTIELGVSEEAEGLRISVRDHGEGVPSAEQERIFERFVRLQEEGAGLGLGLHISRELLRRHGGDLRVEAPPDGGARFVAWLPRAVARASAG